MRNAIQFLETNFIHLCKLARMANIIIIIIIIIVVVVVVVVVVEFLTSQLWQGNIHVSWDAVINRIRLDGLICSLKSFLQLNMC